MAERKDAPLLEPGSRDARTQAVDALVERVLRQHPHLNVSEERKRVDDRTGDRLARESIRIFRERMSA